MTIFVDKTKINQFQDAVSVANSEFDIFSINTSIEEYNQNLYNTAVSIVANSQNPIRLLVQTVDVEQIKRVNESHEIVIRSRNAIVTWSDVACFVRTHNKHTGKDKISLPFNFLDYTLFNIFGANLVKSPLPYTYLADLKKLIKLNNELSCFLANSNVALEKQLNIIFDMIAAKCEESIGIVKARKYNSRLIRMEYVKYSSLIQNFSIVDIDRLIDLVLRQYIQVLTHGHVTATSRMDIHKDQIPIFGRKAQAVSTHINSGDHQTDSYRIVQKTATTNPYFHSVLYSDRRKTRLGIDVDYTIENIAQVLAEQSIDNSKRLWNTLIEYGEYGHSQYSACKHTTSGIFTIECYCETAMYAPNGSAEIKKCPSTLIYLLRKNAWLPDKIGHFFKPAEISPDELYDGFVVSDNNLLITALKIGSNRT